ncbi:VPLPA-CTERM sorting domain-containing protein [uncultured Roseobacter sp.]|uniref:VPLPA-CTERM sorting domain-containing protein n=1 Tax=uncultured Roseobacter sp. TaxID=114847 RepID=UPI00261EA231|nr:VPLPA-CTERM sorting domain-containing protein [uncultured Roseobacter sp.]
MKQITKIAAVALSLAAGAQAASASSIVMTFDEAQPNLGNNGAWTSYQFAGRTFGISSWGHSSEGANLFDTTCSTSPQATSDCAGDRDIIPGGVAGTSSDGVGGNVLIRQRTSDRNGDLANDQANNGGITFTLLAGKALTWLGASAVDDGKFGFFTTTGGINTWLGSIAGLDDSETAALTFDNPSPLIEEGDSFSIFFKGSGAVDSFVFAEEDDFNPTPVPLPAGLPLLLAGLGGLALVSRRRAARQG